MKAHPADVFHDGVDEFGFFFRGVGVVEAEVAFAVELAGEAEVEADGFGVADVEVAVGLGWEAGVDATGVFTGGEIGDDDVADEVGRPGGLGGSLGRHGLIIPPG